MARAASTFKQRDVTRAVRAVVATGLAVAGVKIGAKGEIEVVIGKPEAQDSNASGGAGNEWDTVLRHDKN